MTEAWLAPFVCGGLFCPVPYMEDRGGRGCVVGGATSTQLNYSLIFKSVVAPDRSRTAAEAFEFLLQPRERHYTVCPVY